MEAPSETEVKLRIRDRDALRARLQEVGATLVRERHFEDNVLFDDVADSLRAQGSVLRLRRTPHGGAMTFKGPRLIRDGLKTREEREIAVDEPQALEGILKRLGYRPVFRYQKYRESWLHRGQAVEVDETPIGAFVEIEGDAAGIGAVAAELGYRPDEYLTDSYVGLFFAGGGQGDMVFEASRP
jgi:adenylate cyclase class 2